jgi:hypothetical protein
MYIGWTLRSSKPCGRNHSGSDFLHFFPHDLRNSALGRGVPALPGEGTQTASTIPFGSRGYYSLINWPLYPYVGLLRMHKPDKAKSSHNTVRDTIRPGVNTEVDPGHAGQHPSCHAQPDPQACALQVPTEYPPLWHTQKQPEYGKRRSISPYPVQSPIHYHDVLDGLSKRITYCKANSADPREPYRGHTNSSNDGPLQACYD